MTMPTPPTPNEAEDAEREESFTPDDENLCTECGYGEWRHGAPNHPCKEFVEAEREKIVTPSEGIEPDIVEWYALHGEHREFAKGSGPIGGYYMAQTDMKELQSFVQSQRHKLLAEIERELIDNIDDIANKPWRAVRYLAEKFEALPGKYNAECAAEYRKLEAFYSNGGADKLNELLSDPAFNVNYPEYLAKKEKS